MSHASGRGEDVIAKLIRKVLYVGAFAYIIGNFNTLASIVFRSFAGLGLTASGSTLSMGNFLQPGRLAKVASTPGRPFLSRSRRWRASRGVHSHHAHRRAVLRMDGGHRQLLRAGGAAFVTLIEFKLTTLAGFVLVPFALWNKTAFWPRRSWATWCRRASRCWYWPSSSVSARGCSPSSTSRQVRSLRSTGRWSSCWSRCPCWPWASSGRALRPGWCPAARSWRGRDGRCCHRRSRNRRCGRRCCYGCRRRRGGRSAYGARSRQSRGQWRPFDGIDRQQRQVGLSGGLRFGRWRPPGRRRRCGQCRQDWRAGSRAEGGPRRTLDEGARRRRLPA